MWEGSREWGACSEPGRAGGLEAGGRGMHGKEACWWGDRSAWWGDRSAWWGAYPGDHHGHQLLLQPLPPRSPAAPVAKWAVRLHAAQPPQECRGPPKHLQDVQRSARGPGSRGGHIMGQHLKPIYFASFRQMYKAADCWAQSRAPRVMGTRNF